MEVLAVDPGLRGCGVSLWSDGDLELATYVRNPEKTSNGPQAWKCMKDAILDWLEGWTDLNLVIEVPVIYPATSQKGDQNDLIQLAGVAGAVSCLPVETRVLVYPREWKGSINADVCIERIKERLTWQEHMQVRLPAKSLQHNVWDSIGIGLYTAKRFDVHRVLPT